MPSPRRLSIPAALLLLGGAVVNVVVAWGIAAFGDAPKFALSVSYSRSPDGETNEIKLGIDGRTSLDSAAPWHIGLEPPRGAFATIRASAGQWNCWEGHYMSNRAAFTAAFGWPFPAARTPLPATRLGGPASEPALPAPAFLTDRGLFERSSGAIPISPIFPGAIYSTLLYTAALTPLLLVIPLRCAHRRRRGRCPKCNYD